ncbi:MAG: MFS transporter [Alphaproteobacteria bacterium]|nr:MFS transporter [Alphaproteobacteria bacterium]
MTQAVAPARGRALAGLLIVGLGTTIVPLDTSVNIAFPDITTSFAIPIADIQWVVIFYVLTYTSLLLAFGKLGDLFGHKRIFMTGLMISTCAFAFCAMAPAYHWLLLARFLQGIGASLVLSCGPALATALLPEAQRARALGAYTMMFGVAAAAGPSLGGMMVQAWGWEAVFWFRVPISLAALAALPWLRPDQARKRSGGFDLLGALLLAVSLGALLLALNQLQVEAGRALIIAVLGLAAATAFVWREMRAKDPIIPFAPFRRLDFSVLNIFNALVMFVGFAPLLLVPYYLVRLTEYSLAVSGFILASSPLGQAVAGPIVGWLLSLRPWAPRLALLGAVLVGLATITIGTWGPASEIWRMVLPMFLQGIGLGLFQVCILDVVTGRLDVRDRGVAGSLAQVSRTIGVVLGATGLSLIFASLSQGADFLSAFQSTFTYAGVGLLLCLAVTLLRPRLWFGAT